MTIKVLNDNLAAASDATLSTSELASGYAATDLVTDLLGERTRFVRTFYIHDAASGSVVRNDHIDIVWSAATYNVAVAAGTYNASEVAAAIATALQTIDADFGCTAEASGKFTINHLTDTFTIQWLNGTNAATSIGTTIGFVVSADDSGATSYTSDSVPDGMGHFFKCKFAAPDTINALAFYRWRATNSLTTTLVLDTDATTYRPPGIVAKVYAHGSDLGDNPLLWSDTATLVDTVTCTYTSVTNPYYFNELFVSLLSSASASKLWWYIHMDSTDTATDVQQMEVGYIFLGDSTYLPTSENRTMLANHTRKMILPTKTLAAHSGALFASEAPPYWEIEVNADSWGEADWTELQDFYQSHGKRTPMVWVLDDTAPNSGFTTSWFATFKTDLTLELTDLDFASATLVLRQHR